MSYLAELGKLGGKVKHTYDFQITLENGVTYHAGKVAYATKKDAATAKNRRYRQDRVQLRIYECPGCKRWHLTHTRALKPRKEH